MKIPINLASEPFRRDRAMIVASLTVCVLLMASLGVLISLTLQDNRQLVDVKRELASLHSQIKAVNLEQARFDAVVKKAENADVIERSVFINTLLQRKGLSWNQIFTDLEKTIPYNVKVGRIHPTVDANDNVVLEMTVAAETPAPIVQMFMAFRQSPLFGVAQQSNNAPSTQSEPLYRVALTVPYAQKL